MQQTSSTEYAPAPQAHTLLGRYRVLSTNHDGGFGTVSVCWDTRLQRRVAIKRIPLLSGDGAPVQASTIDEALKEARTSSMLAHPNIVTMYDFEQDGAYSYLVMEYVDGMSLAELLARVEGGVLTFDECAHVADSIAAALAYAHENGVLHLDIKPANILVDRSGTVKLGDFGMATLASAAGYGGARGGTVGYMPPEQIKGQLVDERTDVFSLAVVVWQALTGSCPFAASTPEKSLSLIEHGPSPALSRIEPELAGIVEETLLRALAADPRARMSSVDEFARNLVRDLGDAQEGADSLRYLLNQADEASEHAADEDWGRAHLPLLVRMPWLGGLLVRLVAAVLAGWAAWSTIPHVLPASERALLFGTSGFAVASAAWPPLAGALGIVSLAAALAAQPGGIAIALALGVGVVGVIWWAFVGRTSGLAGAALLLPSALSSPLAGVALAGYALSPGAAFVTGAGSWLLSVVFCQGIAVAFDPVALAPILRAELAAPLTWALAGGCALASWLCALLTRRATVAAATAGQILAVVVLALTYIGYAHMEKASITQALDRPALAIAVILGVTLCIVISFAGAGYSHQEGDIA